MRLRPSLPLLVIVVTVLAGCGRSTSSPAAARVARTDTPSKPAKMICASEAQKDIAKAIGVRTTQPVTAKWADALYSCPYVYAGGTMKLSVKELPDAKTTRKYFDKLAKDLGKDLTVPLTYGEGSFLTKNGSVVVRKEDLVLLVDTRALPAQFGKPPEARSVAAQIVANTIMGCWTGEE